MTLKQALWILAASSPVYVASSPVANVVAAQPSPEQLVVEDDGADASEEANFQSGAAAKSHQVHDEGDDNDDDHLASQKGISAVLEAQKPMEEGNSIWRTGMQKVEKTLWSHLHNAEIFSEYKHMSEEQFTEMAVRETKPLMDAMYRMIDEHTRKQHEQAEKDPQFKWYMDMFGDQYYHDYGKRMQERMAAGVPEEPPTNMKVDDVLMSFMNGTIDEKLKADDKDKPNDGVDQHKSDVKHESLAEKVEDKSSDDDDEPKADVKHESLLEKHRNEQGKKTESKPEKSASMAKVSSAEVPDLTAEVEKELKKDEAEDGVYEMTPADRELLKKEIEKENKKAGIPTTDELMKEVDRAFEKQTGLKVDKEIEKALENEAKELEKDEAEEGDSVPATSAAQMHVEMDADPDENNEEPEVAPRSTKRDAGTIRHHKKLEHKKQIRSASVDAYGNVMNAAVPDPAVRSAAGGEEEPDPKAEGSQEPTEAPAKPKAESSTQDELAIAKRTQYISMAGFAVAVVVIVWLLVRRRAQQLIDRAEAFDDASSVSSSTMTEENPTVKVNRALLERMATISQKLSEKVDEARSGGGSHSSSEYGRAGYRREKKNPQDS